ncbi:hypothetical protein HYPSUDRAFT_723839 [Hypholoma sublateritium FD-334 SS-4]|uniref:Uncharacterized protein n=1 Tax=Hypholoma sublateritium (strain FD-334 SS-4) TaxID=945553 RepID=A0A0D2L3Z6_HYPSF|nr:hypothetical protein HYPSUDRAFT_723839 [Hypholoma sublateritium FD-334 SS-4]
MFLLSFLFAGGTSRRQQKPPLPCVVHSFLASMTARDNSTFHDVYNTLQKGRSVTSCFVASRPGRRHCRLGQLRRSFFLRECPPTLSTRRLPTEPSGSVSRVTRTLLP